MFQGTQGITQWLTNGYLLVCLLIGAANGQSGHYDPQVGFKPAQEDLTSILLQIAGSLEHHGTPEPYYRHISAEHARISEKFAHLENREVDFTPDGMDAKGIEEIIANWQTLSPKLELGDLARSTGRNARLALAGKDGSGTMISEIIDLHQFRIFSEMTSEGPVTTGFDELKALFLEQVASGDIPQLLTLRETSLDPSERAIFDSFLRKNAFAREDFANLEAFYSGPYDRLSDRGKAEMSQRTHAGRLQNPPDLQTDYQRQRQEAISHWNAIGADFETLFSRIDSSNASDDLKRRLKASVISMFSNILIAAQSEFEGASVEGARDRRLERESTQ